MRRPLMLVVLFAAATAFMGGGGCQSQPAGTGPTQVLMSFDRADNFYAAPFPSNDLRRADGSIDLRRFPNPDSITLIKQALALLDAGHQGFATSAGIYFQLSGPIDTAGLPDLAGSLGADSSVLLMDLESKAQIPVKVVFYGDGGPFGAPNLLSLVPLQGVPLRANAMYAAVVRKTLHDAQGHALVPSPTMTALLEPTAAPPSLTGLALADYRRALSAISSAKLRSDDIAGLAVFTTGDPTSVLYAVRDDALSRPLQMPKTRPALTDVFPEYCVYASTIDMPDYQSGEPPFSTTGGAWLFDAAGKPILQRMETASLVLTVPRQKMPAAGFPIVELVRTGAGGDRPLVDRGTSAVHGGPAVVAGTGPAQQFARAGYAGVQVDGPLGGLRNTTHADEQFLTFNVFNAGALRDNVRESAVELALMPRVVEALQFSAADCPGFDAGPSQMAGTVHFDTTHMVLMGHSMGATIAPLVLALAPKFGAAILSGAGGSWIENVMYKEKPVPVRLLAEDLLHFNLYVRDMTENDPALLLVQWSAEPADPQIYDRNIIAEPVKGESPRHILMLQGIVDHYIMPPIANTTSLSLGLDLAGPPLDETSPALLALPSLRPLLPYAGRRTSTLPVTGNVSVSLNGSDKMTKVTAVVVQWPSDGIEDGHEVVFQTDAPKHQYRCFLESLLTGVPTVPPGARADAPCQ